MFVKENNSEVLDKLSNDPSYLVLSTVLKLYMNSDSTKAAAIAKREENTNNFNMLASIAEFFL